MYLKKFLNFLNESGLDWLKRLADMPTNPRQSNYFKWQLENAKKVTISKTPKEIKKSGHLIKECYKNAYKIADENYSKGVEYVEGIVMYKDIPIEHAWNKLGDIYFDTTAEIKGYKYDEYISIAEINIDKLLKYANETGQYGPYLNIIYKDKMTNI